jgi:hypothetical protein
VHANECQSVERRTQTHNTVRVNTHRAGRHARVVRAGEHECQREVEGEHNHSERGADRVARAARREDRDGSAARLGRHGGEHHQPACANHGHKEPAGKENVGKGAQDLQKKHILERATVEARKLGADIGKHEHKQDNHGNDDVKDGASQIRVALPEAVCANDKHWETLAREE